MEGLRDICEMALKKWGPNAQAMMLMGEMGELSAELNRHFNQGRNVPDKIIDELADVSILVCQVSIMFGMDKVNARIIEKGERLKGKVRGVNHE